MLVPDSRCALGMEECLICRDKSSSSLSQNVSLRLWESVWNGNCAESICKLLDLEVETFKPFFLSGHYCSQCKQMMRDVDYFIRTVDSVEHQLSKFRVRVSTLLYDNIDSWIHKTTVPSPLSSYSNNPSSSGSSNPDSFEYPLEPFAPSSVGSDSDFHSVEFKGEEETPHVSPVSSHYDDFENDCYYEREETQPMLRSARVTRPSGRQRKEVSYREDSDPEGSPSPPPPHGTNQIQKKLMDSCYESPLPTTPVITRSSASNAPSTSRGSRKRKGNAASTSSCPTKLMRRSDQQDQNPDFDGNAMEVTEDEHLSIDDLEDLAAVDTASKATLHPRRIRRRRLAPEVALSKKEYRDFLATRKFLYELDQEEIEKNYSYICTSEDCNRRFRELRALRRHKINEHAEALFPCPYQCPFCPSLWFPFDYQLDAHITRVHEGEANCYICPIPDCPIRYKTNQKLVNHLQREHPNYAIEESRTTEFSYGLEHRDQAVMGLVPSDPTLRKIRSQTLRMVRCLVPGCPARRNTQLKLDMHYNQVHAKEPNPTPFNCTEAGCTEVFKTYDRYWDHMKVAHGAIIGVNSGKATPNLQRTRRHPHIQPATTSAKLKNMEFLATKKFLYELDQEEIEKNYSYICTSADCNRRFRELRTLRRHKINEHSEALFPCPFQCPFCPSLWLAFDYQLDAHIIRVHEGEVRCYICPIPDCPSRYKTNLKLVSHLQREHPNYPIEESRTTEFSYGLEHRDQAVMGLVPSHHTLRKIRSQTLRMVRCPVPGCPTRCRTQLKLDMHHNQVHAQEPNPAPFNCREGGCTKAFKTYDRYSDHMKLAHGAIGKKGGNALTCLFCAYRCVGRGNLNWHMRQKHGNQDVPKFYCKLCGFLYFVSEHCEEHEKLHTEETAFACIIQHCQVQGLPNEEALRAHIRANHDVKVRSRVMCDICGSVQSNNWRLRQHKRIHTGEEPHQCTHCEKRFKNKVNLTSHEEIMHGDKMETRIYNCHQCDATFTARQYLYKHNAWHKHGANACLPIAKKKKSSSSIIGL